MENKEIRIDKIEHMGNVRLRLKEENVSELMRDIKQRGLLHDIGVWKKDGKYILVYGNRRYLACKKLGWKTISAKVREGKEISVEQFLADNIAENLHREAISPMEEGRVYEWYNKKMGLSYEEISALTNVSKSVIQSRIHTYKKVPGKFRERVVNVVKPTLRYKKGMPVTIANAILRLRISEKETETLFDAALKKSLTERDIRVISVFLNEGLSVKEAIKKCSRYRTAQLELMIKKDLFNEIKEKGSFNKYIIDILKGNSPPNPELVFVADKK